MNIETYVSIKTKVITAGLQILCDDDYLPKTNETAIDFLRLSKAYDLLNKIIDDAVKGSIEITLLQQIYNITNNFLLLKKFGFKGDFSVETLWCLKSFLIDPSNKATHDKRFTYSCQTLINFANNRLSATQTIEEKRTAEKVLDFCQAALTPALLHCIHSDNDTVFENTFDTIFFKEEQLTASVVREYLFTDLPADPKSNFNLKLSSLKNGVLNRVEQIIAGESEADDLFSTLFRTIKSNAKATLPPVNWLAILKAKASTKPKMKCKKILCHYYHKLWTQNNTKDSWQYAPLHLLPEASQQAWFNLMTKIKIDVKLPLDYLAKLLTNASEGHGIFLLERADTDDFLPDAKAMCVIAHWLNQHATKIPQQIKLHLEENIAKTLALTLPTLSRAQKKQDKIRKAWKSVRSEALATPAEILYRELVDLRMQSSINHIHITQKIALFLSAHPANAFTQALLKCFDNFFTVLHHFTVKEHPSHVGIFSPNKTTKPPAQHAKTTLTKCF